MPGTSNSCIEDLKMIYIFTIDLKIIRNLNGLNISGYGMKNEIPENLIRMD